MVCPACGSRTHAWLPWCPACDTTPPPEAPPPPASLSDDELAAIEEATSSRDRIQPPEMAWEDDAPPVVPYVSPQAVSVAVVCSRSFHDEERLKADLARAREVWGELRILCREGQDAAIIHHAFDHGLRCVTFPARVLRRRLNPETGRMETTWDYRSRDRELLEQAERVVVYDSGERAEKCLIDTAEEMGVRVYVRRVGEREVPTSTAPAPSSPRGP